MGMQYSYNNSQMVKVEMPIMWVDFISLLFGGVESPFLFFFHFSNVISDYSKKDLALIGDTYFFKYLTYTQKMEKKEYP